MERRYDHAGNNRPLKGEASNTFMLESPGESTTYRADERRLLGARLPIGRLDYSAHYCFFSDYGQPAVLA
jgi:hypothetical protein